MADLAAARGVERAEARAEREARGEEGGEAGGEQQHLERPAPRLGEERVRGQLEQPLERDAAQEEIGRLDQRVDRPGLRPHEGEQQPARREAHAVAGETHREARAQQRRRAAPAA